MEQFEWYLADPLCSVVLAVLVLASTCPLIAGALGTLALRTPGGATEARDVVRKVGTRKRIWSTL